MKKSLIRLAVLGLVLGGAVAANAQEGGLESSFTDMVEGVVTSVNAILAAGVAVIAAFFVYRKFKAAVSRT
jgi:hypothetical protein